MTEEIKQDRSPRSPAISLQSAIELVGKLHKAIGKSKVPPSAAASPIGYAGLNGAALTSLGTLTQYGLIDREDSKLSISPLALTILFPESNDLKTEAIRKAALAPKVFSKIRKEFHDCAQEILAHHLIHEGFNTERAKIVASVYKANSAFAKLDEASYVPPVEQDDNRNLKRDDQTPQRGKPLVKSENETPPANPNTPGVRDFVFPLSVGTAAIKIPFPIDEEDFDFILETLQLWKKKLIKQP